MMTVAELIDALMLVDPDLPVVARGYETGYDAVTGQEIITVFKDDTHHDWDGVYQEPRPGYNGTSFFAVFIK